MDFDYTAMPLPGREVCDFCSSPNVKWAYPARDFEYDGLLGRKQGDGSKGGWAACDTCHKLIEKGAWQQIVKRALDKYAAHGGFPSGTRKQTKVELVKLYDLFRSHRSGKPVPHIQGFSAKQEGDNVVMHSDHGMDAEELKTFAEQMAASLSRGTKLSSLTTELPARPAWANARSFNKAWDAMLFDLPRSTDFMTGHTTSPGMRVTQIAFGAMQHAHLVVVEPETVAAIEDMPLPELWRYGLRAQPRWEQVYFDFEGYGGVGVTAQCDQGPATIYGALVWRAQSDGALCIAPVGGDDYVKDKIGYGIDHQDSELVLHHRSDDSPDWFKYTCMGLVRIGGNGFVQTTGNPFGGESLTDQIHFTSMGAIESDAPLTTIAPKALDLLIPDPEWNLVPDRHPGSITTILDAVATARAIGDHPNGKTLFEGQAMLHAEMLARFAQKVLQTMFFIENAPVEISEERVSRQVTRNARRKGIKIGDIVQIRGIRKVTDRPVGQASETGEFPYSHRFMRCGHFRHLSDERYLKSRPDLVTPCDRIGEAMCPGGECRKKWIDPVVVGADHPDLPLVVKTQVFKRSA